MIIHNPPLLKVNNNSYSKRIFAKVFWRRFFNIFVILGLLILIFVKFSSLVFRVFSFGLKRITTELKKCDVYLFVVAMIRQEKN